MIEEKKVLSISKERALQIINNVNQYSDRLSGLTKSIVEYCVLRKDSKSSNNLILFVQDFKTTEHIFSKFVIYDVSVIIDESEIEDFQNFLMSYDPELLYHLFCRLVFLIEFTNNNTGAVWYEIHDIVQRKVDNGKECLWGNLGSKEGISKYAYGSVLDCQNEIIKKIRRISKQDVDLKIINNNGKKKIIIEE